MSPLFAPPEPSSGPARPRAAGFLPAVTCCALFLAFAVPLILRGYDAGRAADDQNRFYLVAVRQFARQWPRFDFRDYASATTPGYHVVLAGVARFVSDDVRLLRLAGAVFTIGLLATVAAAVGRRAPGGIALALCLPLVCSLYVFASGAWALPDNAGWWGVAAVLLIALDHRQRPATWVAGGVVLLALVFVRQVHLWAAGPLVASAWLGRGDRIVPDAAGDPSDSIGPRLGRLAAAIVAVAPAVLVVGWFARLWHGTVPPSFQTIVAGAHNPAVPATILSTLGLLGIFFAGFLVPPAHGERRVTRSWAVVGAIAGLVVGVLPRSNYDMNAGRWSGLWNLVARLPTVAGRSPLVWALSAVGGAVLAAWLYRLPRRDRWVFGIAWAGFIASQSAGLLAWQRYYEPFALIALALMASRLYGTKGADGGDRGAPPVLRRAWVGPVLLSALLAAITFAGLR